MEENLIPAGCALALMRTPLAPPQCACMHMHALSLSPLPPSPHIVLLGDNGRQPIASSQERCRMYEMETCVFAAVGFLLLCLVTVSLAGRRICSLQDSRVALVFSIGNGSSVPASISMYNGNVERNYCWMVSTNLNKGSPGAFT